MTPERAKEVLALVRAENGIDGPGCRRVEREPLPGIRAARWITNGVTDEEDDEIRARWATMPGWTTYYDAIWTIARGGAET